MIRIVLHVGGWCVVSGPLLQADEISGPHVELNSAIRHATTVSLETGQPVQIQCPKCDFPMRQQMVSAPTVLVVDPNLGDAAVPEPFEPLPGWVCAECGHTVDVAH
jgi:hypothetical protein